MTVSLIVRDADSYSILQVISLLCSFLINHFQLTYLFLTKLEGTEQIE